MYKRLPPRLQMFIREIVYGVVGFFAIVGIYAIHKGGVESPTIWWVLLAGYGVGCALKSLTRTVPADILAGHENALEQK